MAKKDPIREEKVKSILKRILPTTEFHVEATDDKRQAWAHIYIVTNFHKHRDEKIRDRKWEKINNIIVNTLVKKKILYDKRIDNKGMRGFIRGILERYKIIKPKREVSVDISTRTLDEYRDSRRWEEKRIRIWAESNTEKDS